VTLRLLQSTEPIPSRRTLTVPALDFSGSGTLNQSDFLSQLKKAIYPGTGQHRAGALCEEAVRLLAANPDRLLTFDQLRMRSSRSSSASLAICFRRAASSESAESYDDEDDEDDRERRRRERSRRGLRERSWPPPWRGMRHR